MGIASKPPLVSSLETTGQAVNPGSALGHSLGESLETGRQLARVTLLPLPLPLGKQRQAPPHFVDLGHPLLVGRYQACPTPTGEEPAGWGDKNSSGLGEESSGWGAQSSGLCDPPPCWLYTLAVGTPHEIRDSQMDTLASSRVTPGPRPPPGAGSQTFSADDRTLGKHPPRETAQVPGGLLWEIIETQSECLSKSPHTSPRCPRVAQLWEKAERRVSEGHLQR